MHADRDGRGRNQMERIMLTQRQDIRRRLDGSIDIDFYRQKGLMERRAVVTGFFSGVGKVIRPAFAIAIVILAISLMPGSAGTGWNAPSATAIAANGPSLVSPVTSARLSFVGALAD
jgi:hypothetical protein